MVQTKSQKDSSRSVDASILSQLAERCEAATGEDRELDLAITLATKVICDSIDPTRVENIGPDPDHAGWVLYDYEGEACTDIVASFTSSLNDAMAIVPNFINRRWYVADSDSDSAGKAVATVYHPADMIKTGRIPRSIGATPAIALCAAALKARAAQLSKAPSSATVPAFCEPCLNPNSPAPVEGK